MRRNRPFLTAAAVVVAIAGFALITACGGDPGTVTPGLGGGASVPGAPNVDTEPSAAPPTPAPSGKDADPLPDDEYDQVMNTTGNKTVALTFDDGPDPTWTPKVLELLREHDVKATFCIVGEHAQAHPDLVRAIVDDGHTLCNHSWNHDFDLGKRTEQEITTDVTRTNDAIHAAAPGAPIEYFRQPGGRWTERVIDVTTGLGLEPLDWSVDTRDWDDAAVKKIVKTVMSNTGKGSIVLMHDGGGDRERTCEALGKLLPKLLDDYRLAALPT